MPTRSDSSDLSQPSLKQPSKFKFSEKSKKNLESAHGDLQKVFNEIIRYFDCSVVHGHRTPEEQFALYKIGRELQDGKWVKVGSVVTHKDGYDKLSKHNHSPSLAVDVVPYPIDWKDVNRMRYFAGFVLGTAQQMYNDGRISSKIVSGFDWDSDTELKDTNFQDAPHFQI